MNRCSLGGYLVSGRAPLPVDPADYDVEALPRRGCNHLRCLSCHAEVRSIQGRRLPDAQRRTDRAALHALPDLADSPLLVPSEVTRFYVCRCSAWGQTAFEDALDDPDTDPYPQRSNMPWRCDGHPALELPHELDGVLITADNLPALVADALHGSVPPGAHPFDRSGAAWAARMHVRLAGTPWAGVVDAVATRSEEDPDPEVRRTALAAIALVKQCR